MSNRDAGTISVIGLGNVSGDEEVLWVSGWHEAEVYALSTHTGRLFARIHVRWGAHGLVWPQPGHYSLSHTGIVR